MKRSINNTSNNDNDHFICESVGYVVGYESIELNLYKFIDEYSSFQQIFFAHQDILIFHIENNERSNDD